MSKTKIAWAIVRISTSEQNPHSQITSLRRIAERLGYSIPEDCVYDEQATGFDDYDYDRKTIVEIKKRLENDRNHPSAIFCWELSRLTRNSLKVGKYIQELSLVHKIPMYFKDLDIWTIDQNGSVNQSGIQQLIGAAAGVEKEREAIRERTSRGRFAKAELNRYVGHLSDGYIVEEIDDEKRIVIDKERMVVIQKIFNLYKDGKSTNYIAALLNAEGVPTTNNYRLSHPTKFVGYKSTYKPQKKGVELDRKQSLWNGSSIAQILKNEWYIGKRQYIGKTDGVQTISLSHDAIIDIETWEIVKAKRLSKEIAHLRGTKKHNALLSGLIFCGNCGSRMYSHVTGLNNHYYCSSYDRGEACQKRGGICKENLEACISSLLTNHAYNDTLQGEVTPFSNFFKADEVSINKAKDEIQRKKILLESHKKDRESSSRAIDTFIDLQGRNSSNQTLVEKYSQKIIEEQKKYDEYDRKIITLEAEINRAENKLRKQKNIEFILKEIEGKREIERVQDFVKAVIERVEVHIVDASCTVVIVNYYNGHTDEIIYSPRLMKCGYVRLKSVLHYDIESKLIQSKNYPLYICMTGDMVVSDKEENEESTNNLLAFLPPVVKTYTNDFAVSDFIRTVRGTNQEIKYERLEGLSDIAVEQQQHYREWRKKYNTGKPTSVPSIIKDADYAIISKERMKLYHRIEKIKKRKLLSEAEKNKLIEEIRVKLSVLRAQVKRLPKENK